MDEDWLVTRPRFASGGEQAIFLSFGEILKRAWDATDSVSTNNAATYFRWKDDDGVEFVAFPSFYIGDFIGGDSPYEQCNIQNENDVFSDCLKSDDDQPALVHKGALSKFLDILKNSDLKAQMEKLSEQKKEEQPIIFVGHSTGGVIATLATICFLGMRLKNIYPLCITFGSPLVGNTALRASIGREDWFGRFCHVVSKHDVVPRMLLAPFESIARHLNSIFPHREGIMEIDSVHLSHPSSLEACRKLLDDVRCLREFSPYKPFGTYMFCSPYGAACIDDSQAALDMLLLTLQSTEGNGIEEENDIASAMISEHTSYGDMLKHVAESEYSTRTANIVPESFIDPESSIDMGIALQLEAMGFGTQNKSAFDALKKAEDLKNSDYMDTESRNTELSNHQSMMAELEWYIKKACRENKPGFYDVFKNQGNLEDFDADLHRNGLKFFWEDTIENVENHVYPSDLRFQNKWINAGTTYRRLVEPLDIAEYYSNKGNSESYFLNRPRRHIVLEKWLEDKDQSRLARGKKNNKVRKMFASLTEDSCFWARVEEATKDLKNLRQEQDGLQIINADIKVRLEKFEADVADMIEKRSISKVVFLEQSSFMIWWRNYREFQLQYPYWESSSPLLKSMAKENLGV